MPIAVLDPLETWLTGTENVRSSGLDQKSLVYSQNDATDPHQTLAIRCCRADKNSISGRAAYFDLLEGEEAGRR
jgi:hypothetical protein